MWEDSRYLSYADVNTILIYFCQALPRTFSRWSGLLWRTPSRSESEGSKSWQGLPLSGSTRCTHGVCEAPVSYITSILPAEEGVGWQTNKLLVILWDPQVLGLACPDWSAVQLEILNGWMHACDRIQHNVSPVSSQPLIKYVTFSTEWNNLLPIKWLQSVFSVDKLMVYIFSNKEWWLFATV